jgi:hypothetical protein
MDHPREVLRSLDVEQALERAKAAQLELEYWQQLVRDLDELNAHVGAITDELLRATRSLLGLLPLVAAAGEHPVATIMDANAVSVKRLRAMRSTLIGTLELVDGRTCVLLEQADDLAAATGIEPPPARPDGAGT